MQNPCSGGAADTALWFLCSRPDQSQDRPLSCCQPPSRTSPRCDVSANPGVLAYIVVAHCFYKYHFGTCDLKPNLVVRLMHESYKETGDCLPAARCLHKTLHPSDSTKTKTLRIREIVQWKILQNFCLVLLFHAVHDMVHLLLPCTFWVKCYKAQQAALTWRRWPMKQTAW